MTNLVDAQQARRVLDRMVGYKISPLLWDKVRRGLSAGRVQTVALRLIVEREQEIRAFVPKEYWTIHALLDAGEPPLFEAKLIKYKGEDIEIPNEAEAQTHCCGGRTTPRGKSPASRRKKSAASRRRRSPLPSCSRLAYNRLRYHGQAHDGAGAAACMKASSWAAKARSR